MYFIPKPKQVEERNGSFLLNYKTRIVIDTNIKGYGITYGTILKNCLEECTGFAPALVKGKPVKGDIFLTQSAEMEEQEYRLTIGEEGIVCTGGSGAGVLYAVQTLCQIAEQSGAGFPAVEITDKPDLLHRGYYLDETRGRVLTLDSLKKMADRLSRYKINEFQLYIEHTYMFQGFSEMWRDETPLTAEEIMELDRYCMERHIELVPSLSSFGHLYTLLSTKTYCDLCEMEDSEKAAFSFWDRMRHHTVNVADDRTLPVIKRMLSEYMALFSSDKFNICADETFDLGKGKAKPLADEKGVHRIYIDYVKKLCEFMVEQGKQPMFWGDVICGEPFLVQELPENVICLNWGYAPDQLEEPTRKMAETGVKQYLCPGVGGWNQWMHLIESCYKNIARMCTFAKKYQAIGILNTDWGDFGHINQPEYSVPGLIYGAAFSWNQEIVPFEEINKEMARLEYGDMTEQIVNLMAQIPQYTGFEWEFAVRHFEENETLKAQKDVEENNKSLEELRKKLKESCIHWGSKNRSLMKYLDITIDGIEAWNTVGSLLKKREAGETTDEGEAFRAAEALEVWFMAYKELWRHDCKEGDLHHIADIVFWYADCLRSRERKTSLR